LLGIFLSVAGFSAVFALLGVVLGAVLQGMGVLVFTNKLSLLANFQLLNELLL
jgi:hypothetical protein